MDLTNFSKGIITDVSREDAQGDQSLTDSVNFDYYPGELRKRYGTSPHDFPVYSFNPDADFADAFTLVSPGLPEDETVVQIEIVACGRAYVGSLRNWYASSALEVCRNATVTFIMTQVDAFYKLYGDIHLAGYYEQIIDDAARGIPRMESFDGERPFMVPRESSIAIGNVKTMTTTGTTIDVGSTADVIIVTHLKRVGPWVRNGKSGGIPGAVADNDYAHMGYIDTWEVTTGEIYDYSDDIQLELAITNYSKLYKAANATNSPLVSIKDPLDASVTLSAESVIKRGISPWMIGGEPRKFNVMVTAEVDGFQESRPLRWSGSRVSLRETKQGAVQWGDDTMPQNWRVLPDKLHNQFVRVEMVDSHPRAVADFVMEYGHTARRAATSSWIRGRLVWNKPWSENQNPDVSGENFVVTVTIVLQGHKYEWSEPEMPRYAWKFDSGVRKGLDLIVYVTEHYRLDNPYTIMALLGAPWPADSLLAQYTDYPSKGSLSTDQRRLAAVLHWMKDYAGQMKGMEGDHYTVGGRAVCQSLWSVDAWTFQTSTVATTPYDMQGPLDGYIYCPNGYDQALMNMPLERIVSTETLTLPVNVSQYPLGPALYQDDKDLTTPAFTIPSTTFHMLERVGLGTITVLPKINSKLLDSWYPEHIRPLSRITAIKIYTKEDDVDIDYVLRRRIPIDFDVADVESGGYGEEDVVAEVLSYREDASGFSARQAPTWMLDNGRYVPFFQSDLVPSLSPPTYGYIRGWIPSEFMLSDLDMKGNGGLGALSQFMMRDIDEPDGPQWKRGARFEGRMFGISNYNGNLQYSIMSAGVCQWDIMPRRGFIVGDGEKLTHVVSWRDQFHLIFTPSRIWRIDLADGDIFRTRTLDTFAGRGTEYWLSIVNHPTGVYWVSPDGIWSYRGELPRNVAEGKWLREFVDTWRSRLSTSLTVGGFNHAMDDIWWALDGTSTVWLYRPREDNFRKYVFGVVGLEQPRYMTMYRDKFLISFGPGTLNKMDYDTFTDDWRGEDSAAYECYAISQELPPMDETALLYWQYAGVRYELDGDEIGTLRFLLYPYADTLHPGLLVALNPSRQEYFFPVPKGISRNMRVEVGQGWRFGVANDHHRVVFKLVSLRATGLPQWGGTR